MSRPVPLYQLMLEDYSTPSFVSCSKPYFGTQEQILALLERRRDPELFETARQYFSGSGSGEGPMLHWREQIVSPVERLGSVPFQMENVSVTFLNTWDCPYELHAQRAEGKLYYLSGEDGVCFRALEAVFTDLMLTDVPFPKKVDRLQPFWGYPDMIYCRDGKVKSRLLLAERRFQTREEALADLAHPAPISFDCFFEDIFGDG